MNLNISRLGEIQELMSLIEAWGSPANADNKYGQAFEILRRERERLVDQIIAPDGRIP